MVDLGAVGLVVSDLWVLDLVSDFWAIGLVGEVGEVGDFEVAGFVEGVVVVDMILVVETVWMTARVDGVELEGLAVVTVMSVDSLVEAFVALQYLVAWIC